MRRGENEVSPERFQRGKRDADARDIVGHQVEVVEVGSVFREVVQGRSTVFAEEATRRYSCRDELGGADGAAESLEEEEEVGGVGRCDGVAAWRERLSLRERKGKTRTNRCLRRWDIPSLQR
jgi:hypothetical protein